MRDAQPRYEASISLSNDTIQFVIENRSLRFQVNEIQLVGEFSAPRGVYSADYFFVMKICSQEQLIEIPAYTDGIFELLADLKPAMPSLQNPRLQMSEDFSSNVMFPGEFGGQPLFEFKAEIKPWIDLPMLRNLVWVETTVKQLNPALPI